MMSIQKAYLQTVSVFYVFVQVSGTTNTNQNTSSDIAYSSRSDHNPTSNYSPTSNYRPTNNYKSGNNYYTPGIYNPEKSYFNPSARTKGDAALSTYPGSGYSYRNYNTIPVASTVYNNYKGIPQLNHGYYGKGTSATDYNRPTSGYLQGRVNKNNWQNNYRFASGVQDFRSRWSHTPSGPPAQAPLNYRPYYGGFVTKAGSGGNNYALLRDSRLYSGAKVGQLPSYAPATTKKTGVFVIPTPSKLYYDGVKS